MNSESIVNKIIEMRERYAGKLSKVRNVKDFNSVYDTADDELKTFAKEHNIGISSQIIFATQEDFDKYVETGTIGEFIVIPGLI